jgi:hypothetical protein
MYKRREMIDTESQEPIVLTGAEEELLTGILGDILDGTGGYEGRILVDVSELYNKLTTGM